MINKNQLENNTELFENISPNIAIFPENKTFTNLINKSIEIVTVPKPENTNINQVNVGIVLEEKLEKLINIFKVTGYRKIIDFNNINVVDVKYENINERYEAYVDLLNLFITEINKIIKIDLIEKKSITFLKELEEHLQKVINITGSLGQWNKDNFN